MRAALILRLARARRRHRGLGDEKRACDFLGCHASEESERERDLCLSRECRVEAGEDEGESIVVHGSRFFAGALVVAALGCESGHLAEEFLSASFAA